MTALYHILVLHGPNLNLLGMREPQHYGQVTLEAIDQQLKKHAEDQQAICTCHQSNSESELIHYLHQAAQTETQFILINPAAFTHTSIALRDALAAINIPFIEIHLSNVYAREPFRHHSYFSDLAVGTITGLGAQGYTLALTYALAYLNQSTHTA